MTPYLVILVGFAVLLLAMLVVEVLGRAARGSFTPLARALEAAMGRSTGRVIVGATWLWLGFHFLAR